MNPKRPFCCKFLFVRLARKRSNSSFWAFHLLTDRSISSRTKRTISIPTCTGRTIEVNPNDAAGGGQSGTGAWRAMCRCHREVPQYD